MTRLVTSFAGGLANRTSRRSFLGRSGQLLLGAVGGSALLGLIAGTAHGTILCTCNTPCLHWTTCDCGGNPVFKIKNHYDCPGCLHVDCAFTRCTNLTC
jgi:hypothetical protein